MLKVKFAKYLVLMMLFSAICLVGNEKNVFAQELEKEPVVENIAIQQDEEVLEQEAGDNGNIEVEVEVQESEKTYLARVKKNGKYNVIDISGKVILPEYVNNVSITGNKVLVAKVGKKYGFYTIFGEKISNLEFDDYISHPDKFIAVCQKKKWGFINLQGKQVIPMEFDSAGNFNEGLAPVKVKKTLGLYRRKW